MCGLPTVSTKRKYWHLPSLSKKKKKKMMMNGVFADCLADLHRDLTVWAAIFGRRREAESAHGRGLMDLFPEILGDPIPLYRGQEL
jgi:hypothetical protein